jgi:UDP-glucose 4-epimerase
VEETITTSSDGPGSSVIAGMLLTPRLPAAPNSIAAMARSLVTGGAGFMGAHLVRELLARGDEVVALDDLSGGFRDNVDPAADFVQASVTDAEAIEALFAERRFDRVYHLAAYAAEGLSHFIKRFNYDNNVIGSVTLINAAVNHGVDCFVFTSSIAVYGAEQTPMLETMTPEPEDSYGIAKRAVELELRASKEMFGLDYVVFRPHNVYGERQNIADKYRNVIGIFMNQVLSGRPMTIFGDGLQTRAFSHVDDVAPIIARAPLVEEALGQVFNVGADRPYTVLELAREVRRAMGRGEIEHLPPRNEVVHAFASHERVRSVFQPPEPIALPAGVERMAAWVRDHGARPPVEFGEIEVPINLPPSWATRASRQG